MEKITNFRMAWNAQVDEGTLFITTADEKVHQILVDSPAEASLLLNILKNDDPSYEEATGLIYTGFDETGD